MRFSMVEASTVAAVIAGAIMAPREAPDGGPPARCAPASRAGAARSAPSDLTEPGTIGRIDTPATTPASVKATAPNAACFNEKRDPDIPTLYPPQDPQP